MMKFRLTAAAAVVAAMILLDGCRTAPRTPPAPPVPVATRPALPKTFGQVSMNAAGGLTFSYKDLRVGVDAPDGTLDFYLVTTLPRAWSSELRREQKIVAPADAADSARKAGFPNAKALGAGQRLLLSKPGAFLFVSAVQQRNPATGKLVNGYLLEFDNGRNLFASGDTVDLAPVREFVYGIRDDGKALNLAFINAAAPNEARAAEFISLLQPEVAVVLNRGGVDANKLTAAFSEQIFGGGWFVAAPSDTTPF